MSKGRNRKKADEPWWFTWVLFGIPTVYLFYTFVWSRVPPHRNSWIETLPQSTGSGGVIGNQTWVIMIDGNHYSLIGWGQWDFEEPRDVVLERLWRQRGVPASQVHVILSRGGVENVRQKVASIVMAAENSKATHLVFYFQGHAGANGLVIGSSEVYTSYLLSLDLRYFTGVVILHADACQTGFLSFVPLPRAAGVVVLTSAHYTHLSTSSWAFTDCLIRVYAGDESLDFDRDGVITLHEAKKSCGFIMIVTTSQHIGFWVSRGVNTKEVVMSSVVPSRVLSIVPRYEERQCSDAVQRTNEARFPPECTKLFKPTKLMLLVKSLMGRSCMDTDALARHCVKLAVKHETGLVKKINRWQYVGNVSLLQLRHDAVPKNWIQGDFIWIGNVTTHLCHWGRCEAISHDIHDKRLRLIYWRDYVLPGTDFAIRGIVRKYY